jgi:hypothetical protein
MYTVSAAIKDVLRCIDIYINLRASEAFLKCHIPTVLELFVILSSRNYATSGKSINVQKQN